MPSLLPAVSPETLAEKYYDIAFALFLLGFIVLLFAPETRDRDLPE